MARPLRCGIGAVGALLVALLGAGQACAMGMESFGPAGEQIGRSSDWARGVEDVLRDPSRVYWYDVNGSEAAYYDGDMRTVNRLLELYSQIEMAEHPVVLQAGRGSAESFNREKSTPYNVSFRVPGRLEISSRKRRGNVAAHDLVPRLFVCLDAELAERVNELKFPKHVALETGPPAGAADAALQKKIADFVAGHPQGKRVLDADELLAALKAADAKYFEGFTARGTRVDPEPSGRDKLIAWTVTMGNRRMVIEQRDVEDSDHPPTEGRFEYTHFVGPEQMGSIHRSRVWIDGKLTEVRPHATFEPVGYTYDLLIGKVVWPLGRGFSHCLGRVTDITPEPDGTLRASAEGEDKGLGYRWELLVDPRSDYLVRAAKAYRRNDATLAYTIENAGTLTGGGRSVAHTAQWIEGAESVADSIAVTSVSAASDDELIQRTEERLGQLPGIGE